MTVRDRRAILTGAAIVLLALTLRCGPIGARAVGRVRNQASESVALASRARAVAAGLPALRDSVQRTLAVFVAAAPKLFSRNPGEAANELRAAITAAADHSRLRVLRVDPEASAADSTAVAAIAVSAELEGDVGQDVGFDVVRLK